MKNINKNCKKYFYILFTLLFFTSVFTLTGISKEEAAATETSTATYSSATPQISYSVTGNKTVGSTITIAVNVTNGANIYGGSLDLLFDSNMLEITSAQMGSLFQKDLKAPLINDTKTPGRTSVVITLSGANKKLSVTNGSLVIINAKVKKEGTLNLKTTNDLSKLSLNGFTSCIKLSSINGVKLNYTSTDVSFKLTALILSDGEYENDNSALIYNGYWPSIESSNYSGGYMKIAKSPNSSLEFYFSGTSFELYGLKAKMYGKATVNIDGKNVATIDAYNSSTIYNALLYKSDTLSKSTHKVTITTTGTKNSNSSSTDFAIDKIIIKDASKILIPGTYQDNNQSLTYTGSWTSITSSNYNGGSIKLAKSSGSSLKFTFSGTSFELYGLKTKMYGKATVNIDGKNVATIDAYNSSTEYNSILYSSNNLQKGIHYVTITTTGTKNPSSSSIDFAIDKIIIDDTSTLLNPGIYQDNNSSLIYSGSWTSITSSNYNGGSIKLAKSSGSSLKFTFSGTSFELYGLKAKMYGIATVNIDGKNVATIDAYNASTIYNSLLYCSSALTNDNHTVIITTTGTKNPNSSSIDFAIDRIVINSNSVLRTGTYEENSNLLSYCGNWTSVSSSNYSGGSIKITKTPGSTLKFTFLGTSFELYGLKTKMYGKATVNIDGKNVATIDAYNANTIYNSLLYSCPSLDNGTHMVTITSSNIKNASSSSTDFAIDKVIIK